MNNTTINDDLLRAHGGLPAENSTLQIPNNFAKGTERGTVTFFRSPHGEARALDMNKCKNRTNLFRAAANLRGGTSARARALPRTSRNNTKSSPRLC